VRAALVPYIMPGFALAKKAQRGVARANPDVEGLVLLKHGIFSMGATAEEAYVRMNRSGDLGREASRQSHAQDLSRRSACPRRSRRAAEIAPDPGADLVSFAGQSRAAARPPQRFVFEFRSGPEILAYVAGKEIDRL